MAPTVTRGKVMDPGGSQPSVAVGSEGRKAVGTGSSLLSLDVRYWTHMAGYSH